MAAAGGPGAPRPGAGRAIEAPVRRVQSSRIGYSDSTSRIAIVKLKARTRDGRSSTRRTATPHPAQSATQGDADQRQHPGDHQHVARVAVARGIGGHGADHHHPGLRVHPLEQQRGQEADRPPGRGTRPDGARPSQSPGQHQQVERPGIAQQRVEQRRRRQQPVEPQPDQQHHQRVAGDDAGDVRQRAHEAVVHAGRQQHGVVRPRRDRGRQREAGQGQQRCGAHRPGIPGLSHLRRRPGRCPGPVGAVTRQRAPHDGPKPRSVRIPPISGNASLKNPGLGPAAPVGSRGKAPGLLPDAIALDGRDALPERILAVGERPVEGPLRAAGPTVVGRPGAPGPRHASAPSGPLARGRRSPRPHGVPAPPDGASGQPVVPTLVTDTKSCHIDIRTTTLRGYDRPGCRRGRHSSGAGVSNTARPWAPAFQSTRRLLGGGRRHDRHLGATSMAGRNL